MRQKMEMLQSAHCKGVHYSTLGNWNSIACIVLCFSLAITVHLREYGVGLFVCSSLMANSVE